MIKDGMASTGYFLTTDYPARRSRNQIFLNREWTRMDANSNPGFEFRIVYHRWTRMDTDFLTAEDAENAERGMVYERNGIPFFANEMHGILPRAKNTIQTRKDAMQEFIKAYGNKILGAIHGWDRIRFRGTIRWLASTRGFQSFLATHHMLLKEVGAWAEGITQSIRAACEAQALKLGIPLIYLKSSGVDKDGMAQRVAREREVKVGDICMFSVLEVCNAPRVTGNRATKKLEVQIVPRKCIWIYHYWNDSRFGLGHTRLQTWLPLSATICLNGRHWLERQLIQEGLRYGKDRNCFWHLEDFSRTQKLLDEQLQTDWPVALMDLLDRSCPMIRSAIPQHPLDYYWSADETEWATDILFRSSTDLQAMGETLLRHGLFVAQSPAVMRFLGRQDLRGTIPAEVKTDLKQRYEGLRIKHWVNRNSVKMYNKTGNLLRVETTINSTRDFKVYRHPDDDPTRQASWQKMRKGVSDLHRRAQVSQASNERYLDHLSATVVHETLLQSVSDICSPVRKNGRRHRGLNPWRPDDFKVLQYIARGEVQLNGFRNRDLRGWLYPDLTSEDPQQGRKRSGQVTRRIRLLRAHGLVQKVSRTTRYVLTAKGHKVVAAVLAASHADVEQLMNIAA